MGSDFTITQALTLVTIILASQLALGVVVWMNFGVIRRLQLQNADLQRRIWLKRVAEGPSGVQGAIAIADADKPSQPDPFVPSSWPDSLSDGLSN